MGLVCGATTALTACQKGSGLVGSGPLLANVQVEQLAANTPTIPQDAIASLLQRLVSPSSFTERLMRSRALLLVLGLVAGWGFRWHFNRITLELTELASFQDAEIGRRSDRYVAIGLDARHELKVDVEFGVILFGIGRQQQHLCEILQALGIPAHVQHLTLRSAI